MDQDNRVKYYTPDREPDKVVVYTSWDAIPPDHQDWLLNEGVRPDYFFPDYPGQAIRVTIQTWEIDTEEYEKACPTV